MPFIDDTISTTFTVTGLYNNSKYTFCVDAIDDAGETIAIGRITVTTAPFSP